MLFLFYAFSSNSSHLDLFHPVIDHLLSVCEVHHGSSETWPCFTVVPSLREESDGHSTAGDTWLQPVRGALGGQLAGMWTKLSGGKGELLKGKSEVGLARPIAHGERNNQDCPVPSAWPVGSAFLTRSLECSKS